MKILHTVEFYHPSIGGSQEVVRQISEHLVNLGHEVTVATTADPKRNTQIINGVKVLGFDLTGNTVRGIDGDQQGYLDLLTSADFDIIMNYAAQQWATDAALPILERIPAKKVFVPCGYSGLFRPEYRDYFRKMKTWLKQYDACVYASEKYRDINFAHECGADNNVLIPNGTSAKEFGPKPKIDIRLKLSIPRDHSLILLVGSHTGLKGHGEAIQIFKKANIRQSCLLIIANGLIGGCLKSCTRAEKLYRLNPTAARAGKRIMIKSLPREETVAAYHAANIFLFPSQVECSPLVLFEAMASKTPFLTTDTGNSREIIDWSKSGQLLPGSSIANGFVRADIKRSASILADLLADPKKREALALAGHQAWTDNFTWEKIAKEYEELYKNLLGGRRIKDGGITSKRVETH